MSLIEELEQLESAAQAELAEARTAEALEAWRIKYLATKGAVKEAMRKLAAAPKDQKPALGKACNRMKNSLQEAYGTKSAEISAAGVKEEAPAVDVTLPGRRPEIGHVHIITQTVNEICEIFARMGFTVAYGPELEDERHNFTALNIPESHPARDPLDHFYIDDRTCLRAHTSTVQIRVMESTTPPVRIIAPGRCYRPDTVDATHHFMFHQVEGLYVDEGVTMGDLKTCRAMGIINHPWLNFTKSRGGNGKEHDRKEG